MTGCCYRFGNGLPACLGNGEPFPSQSPVPRSKVVVYGDSCTASRGGEGPYGWPQLLATELGIETVNQAVSGSGYVRPANGSTFPFAASIYPEPDAAVAVVMGSQNDQAQDPAAVRLAATVTYAAITTRSPAARLLIVGPFWYDNNPPDNLYAVRDAIAETATLVGATFLDPLGERWLTSRSGLILAGDGKHPNLAGQAVIAGRVGPHLAALLDSSPPN